MSAPEDRLISDVAAERFKNEAVEILTSNPYADLKVRELAMATLALTRDRDARHVSGSSHCLRQTVQGCLLRRVLRVALPSGTVIPL